MKRPHYTTKKLIQTTFPYKLIVVDYCIYRSSSVMQYIYSYRSSELEWCFCANTVVIIASATMKPHQNLVRLAP